MPVGLRKRFASVVSGGVGTLSPMTLPLPIAPRDALLQIIDPALLLLPPSMASDRARVQELTTTMQESGLRARVQVGGPAHGLWQMERAGGVAGVLSHLATAKLAAALCAVRGVPAVSGAVYDALPNDDLLAAGFARLLIFTDAAPLPALGDPQGAFEYYLRTWRPGAYARGSQAQRDGLRSKWGTNYATAMAAVVASGVH